MTEGRFASARFREAVVWMVICPAVSLTGAAAVAAFVTAGAWKSHVLLPGVVATCLAAVVCAIGFMRMPWTFWWAKLIALAAFTFSAYQAVFCIGFYWLFHLGHWQD